MTRGAEGAIAPTHAAEWAERLRRVVSDGSRCTVPLTDSSARAWLVSLSPYAQIDGHPVGVVVTLVEVTELHRLQREEREFLQFLSHDLRSPQNAVLALVDLARAKASGSEVPELLARIERHAERSLALIDALLMQQRADRLSRAEFEQVELAQLMHDAADQAWPGAQARSQRMQVLGGHDGAWVWGSRELLLRAVVNLAHNASQYSGPWTHIELALVRDGAHWLCEVRDNGVGIAAEHVPRLFERHFRAPRSGEAAATEGRGLGLAFVHTVAGRHGGSIAVASQLGGGSTFTLRVPAAATPDDGGAADDDEGARDPPVLAGARADTR